MIIYFTVNLKVYKKYSRLIINLQLNIYPNNTLFYNNLAVYSVIIHITIWLLDVIKTYTKNRPSIFFPSYFFKVKKWLKNGITRMMV